MSFRTADCTGEKFVIRLGCARIVRHALAHIASTLR